ncbi:MAG: sigma-70 family RNA polymerase sigma factor [Bacteroidetes bacterium]|nr:sigma-70 family RNA polymerase sigma factor [Bacteroidota bacterium]
MSYRTRDLKITQSITNRETLSLEAYFREVSKVDLLTPDEEVELARKIRQGDLAATEKLIKTNLRFVISVAKKYQNFGISLPDLISEGNMGLIEAAKRFDETRGFKFISFAVWWIRQGILSALSEQRRMIRLPTNQLNLLIKIRNAADDLENRLERQPTDLELANVLEMDLARIDHARFYSGRTDSLDAPLGTEDEYCLLDLVENAEDATDRNLLAESERIRIAAILRVLSEREKRIIEMSFGFEGEWPMLPRDIAPVLGMSSERVREVKMEALRKLKACACSL